jgi:hypothetical protein
MTRATPARTGAFHGHYDDVSVAEQDCAAHL